jgi:hypothetical protein
MTIAEAKTTDIESLLWSFGFKPKRKNGKDLFYISPIRHENKPSFKVNTEMNVWYDFGTGKGGNVVDLVCYLNNCNVKTALSILDNSAIEKRKDIFSFSSANNSLQKAPVVTQVDVIDVTIGNIMTKALLQYLQERKIPLRIASEYCKEIHYTRHKRKYYGIAFKNDTGGYEIRNKYAKMNLFGKDITTIKPDKKNAIGNVYEGFFDFLSCLTINIDKIAENHVILNSTALIDRIISSAEVKNYDTLNLYLDNDPAGDKATAKIINSLDNAKDERFYPGFKDLNEYLISLLF